MAGAFGHRERAEGFGAAAERYDRVRPSYPAAVIDWLTGDAPGRAVDVGCGTGRVAGLLLAAGWAVVGVEPDPRMAEVARRHGVIVEVSGFEAWPRDEPDFDLLCAGQAWHWIDPTVGVPKAARLLRPGGRLALFWNSYRYDERVLAVLVDAFQRHAPEELKDSVLLGTADPAHLAPHDDVIRSAGDVFGPPEARVFDQERERTVAEWIDEAATTSSIALLAPEITVPLFAEISERLTSITGGRFVTAHPTQVITAVRR